MLSITLPSRALNQRPHQPRQSFGHGMCTFSVCTYGRCQGHRCTCVQECGCIGVCYLLLSCGICYGTLGSTCQVVQTCGCAGHYCIAVTCPARKEDPCPGGSMWFGYCMQSYATKH